jgi:hypothetical protein
MIPASISNCTPAVARAWQAAEDIGQAMASDMLETEHVLAGLLQEE